MFNYFLQLSKTFRQEFKPDIRSRILSITLLAALLLMVQARVFAQDQPQRAGSGTGSETGSETGSANGSGSGPGSGNGSGVGTEEGSDNGNRDRSKTGASIHLIGGVGKNEVLTDEIQRALGIKCTGESNGGMRISEVQKGSDAYNSGVQQGDHVADAKRYKNQLELTLVNDDGAPQKFSFELNTNRERMLALIPRPDAAPPPPPPPPANRNYLNMNASRDAFNLNANKNGLNLNPQKPQLDNTRAPRLIGNVNDTAKFLANYNIELIVDKSLSMRRRDCPGMLSRWEWCASQSQELGRQIAPLVPQGLTIIPFARFYDTFERQQPQQIANMFFGTELQRGTRLAEPLDDRLRQAISRRAAGAKPTIIAIITDGIPAPAYEPQAVVDVLINASRQIRNPTDVTVVFFQIGSNDPFGERYLQDLDTSLVSWGARFDYVHTVPFEQLKRFGLARSLVDSLRTLESQRHG